ncbi:unnamed protein product [Sympodiomycopsis kandeliae]
MICIPTPNHRKLVQDCYPPPKKLAGTENPNSNELGKLVYYAKTKPAKLTKVGKLLEARAATDSRSLTQEKSRCGLLITLSILKSLIQECPNDVTYISKSAQDVLSHSLSAASRGVVNGARDLELDSRVSSTFFTFTAALDPSRTSIEDDLGKTYLALLQGFADMSMDSSKQDEEDRNRHRLIGLGALSGAVGSEIMYSSSFPQQAAIIIPALLGNIHVNTQPLDILDSEAQKTTAGTPSFSEFTSASKKRPAHRKAPSLSSHVAGEKGPSTTNVVSAAMGILQSLFRHADALQVQESMKAVFTWMDGRSSVKTAPSQGSQWSHEEWACLLAKTVSRWTALHYRFVVMNALVEHLVESCDGPSQAKDATLLAMIAQVLKSKDLTLVGISTSDTLNNLAGLAVRRVHFDLKDPLLPQIVEAIESLAVHVYYADQLNDVAEELVARIIVLTQPEVSVNEAAKTSRLGQQPASNHNSNSKTASLEQRAEGIRILLFALTRVIIVANSSASSGGDQVHAASTDDPTPSDPSKEKGKETGPSAGITIAGTRQRIQPELLQPTTFLLASPNASIRLTEAQLLIAYFQYEALEPPAASSEAASLMHGIGAATHVAAISKSLRIAAPRASNAQGPLHALVSVQTANNDPAAPLDTGSGAAVPIDYAALTEVLISSVEKLSVAALLAIVPALISIDRAAAQNLVPDSGSSHLIAQKRRASRLLLAKVWEAVGSRWSISSVQKEAESVLSALADHFPPLPSPPAGLTLAGETELFPQSETRGEGSLAASEAFNSSNIVKGIANSPEVQAASRLDADDLTRWLTRDWNVSIAVDDAAVGASPYQDSDFGANGSGPASGSGVNGDTGHKLSFKSAGEGAAGASAAGNANTSSGVEELRQALGNRTYSRGGGTSSVRKNLNAAPQDPDASFASSVPASNTSSSLSAAERRASRRASRGGLRLNSATTEGSPAVKGLPTINGGDTFDSLGNNQAKPNAGDSNGIGGLLDSLGVASSGAARNGDATSSTNKQTASHPQAHSLVPPHAV